MTYLERITFLYGEYIQLTGYLFKNTCMLMTMLSSDDKTMCDSISFFNKVEAESYRAYKYFSSLSTEKKEEMISSSLLSNSCNILQIIFVNIAVINASIVYAIVAINKFRFPTTNVTIKNIANIIPATKNGHLKIFCSAIDIIITAIGKAKNISKVFISFSPFLFLLYFMLLFYLLLLLCIFNI